MSLLNPIYKWLAIAVASFGIIIGAYFYGYNHGETYQQGVYAVAQAKANAQTVKKNETVQTLADKTEVAQVAQQEKIVVKYQTITKEVVKYVETPAAHVFLDSEFVSLHDSAAAGIDSPIQVAQPASDAASGPQATTITTGDAIGVITDNYKQYQSCVAEVIGWIQFYDNLQREINK